MRCSGESRCGTDFLRCKEVATQQIWCPTWIGSEKGPIYFCDEHSQIFIDSSKGAFFFGEDATKEFDSVVKFIRCSDSQYVEIRHMLLLNGLHVCGDGGVLRPGIFVIDGECWLLSHDLATHLGKFDDVVQRYGPNWKKVLS